MARLLLNRPVQEIYEHVTVLFSQASARNLFLIGGNNDKSFFCENYRSMFCPSGKIITSIDPSCKYSTDISVTLSTSIIHQRMVQASKPGASVNYMGFCFSLRYQTFMMLGTSSLNGCARFTLKRCVRQRA